MKFDKVIPFCIPVTLLKVSNYFTEQLKFDNKWEWDNPPTFGCAYKDSVEIFLKNRTMKSLLYG
jgi:hypothetical protein